MRNSGSVVSKDMIAEHVWNLTSRRSRTLSRFLSTPFEGGSSPNLVARRSEQSGASDTQSMLRRHPNLRVRTRIALTIFALSTGLLVLMSITVYLAFDEQLRASLDDTLALRAEANLQFSIAPHRRRRSSSVAIPGMNWQRAKLSCACTTSTGRSLLMLLLKHPWCLSTARQLRNPSPPAATSIAPSSSSRTRNTASSRPQSFAPVRSLPSCSPGSIVRASTTPLKILRLILREELDSSHGVAHPRARVPGTCRARHDMNLGKILA